jgi:CheY-like chemotaxis protein
MQQLRITVEDEGIGINDEKKSTLFKPFQQTMRLAGGTGLGLFSLSKRIEVLKGRFGVEDKPDGKQGSCFWFSIPYTPDEDSANVVSPMRLVESIDETSASARMMMTGAGDIIDDNAPTALVVDDSAVIAKSTKRMLMNAGYKVDVADNGAIGLEKMKAKVYSTVIMDLQMPVMDGLEATRRIRLFEDVAEFQASGIRRQFIIGASANGADDVMRDALESGMDVFVEKPFSVSILAECHRQAKREAPDNLV